MKKPFFSIIIPTLNEEKYLPHLLNDLAAQTFHDFEVIVVDGHSEDRTVILAKKLREKPPSLRIISSPRRHVCTQRNLGAKHALADILIFMDADNRLPSYFLQGVKYHLESDPTDIATTYMKSDHTYSQGESIALAINIVLETTKNTHTPFINESMTIITKSAFIKLKGFDETINYNEGRTMLDKAVSLGLKFKVYKDPTYEYSYRRIRKYGLLGITSRIARYEIAKLLEIPLKEASIQELYPMKGGGFFDTPSIRRQRFRHKIQSLLREIQSPRSVKSKLLKLLEQ